MRGSSLEDFICQAQDRQRNAHSKAMSAGFQSWVEQLQSDQVQYESQRIMSLESGLIIILGCFLIWFLTYCQGHIPEQKKKLSDP